MWSHFPPFFLKPFPKIQCKVFKVNNVCKVYTLQCIDIIFNCIQCRGNRDNEQCAMNNKQYIVYFVQCTPIDTALKSQNSMVCVLKHNVIKMRLSFVPFQLCSSVCIVFTQTKIAHLLGSSTHNPFCLKFNFKNKSKVWATSVYIMKQLVFSAFANVFYNLFVML